MENYKDKFTPEELEYLRARLIQRHTDNNGVIVEMVENRAYSFEDRITTPDILINIWGKISELYDAEHQNAPGSIENDGEDLGAYGEKIIKSLFEDEITTTNPEALALFDENVTALVITNEKYYGALRPQKNNTAYVINLDKQLCFSWNKDGEPIISTVEERKLLDDVMDRDEIPADCADTELLEIFAGAVASAYIFNMRDRITVNYPSFFKAMKAKNGKEKYKHYDVMERIKRLENIGGVLVEQKRIQRVFVWVEIDEDRKTLTFESPYLYSIMDLLKKEPAYIATTRKNDKPVSNITGVSFLVNASIASAKNKTTAEIVQYIAARLHQRGRVTVSQYSPNKEYKDKKLIKVEITYRQIIDNCPRLAEAMKEARQPTQVLQRSILGTKYEPNKRSKHYYPVTLLEEYIKKYTTLCDYWRDFKIKEIQDISVKNLNNKIVITHHGYNGDFENPYHLPEILGKGTPETF